MAAVGKIPEMKKRKSRSRESPQVPGRIKRGGGAGGGGGGTLAPTGRTWTHMADPGINTAINMRRLARPGTTTSIESRRTCDKTLESARPSLPQRRIVFIKRAFVLPSVHRPRRGYALLINYARPDGRLASNFTRASLGETKTYARFPRTFAKGKKNVISTAL